MIYKRELNWKEVNRLIKEAIREDVGSGDVTTESLFDDETLSRGVIFAKENGMLAGLPVAKEVFNRLGSRFKWEDKISEGGYINEGDVIVEFQGPGRQILTGERLALNILQRLSGIATYTSRFVKEVDGLDVKIVDTRKTTPGLRVLEKYAVTVGGGYNHRMGLYDGVMIKDNHIKEAGGIRQAVEDVRKMHGSHFRIEVETTNHKQVSEAIDCAVDIIMLDNMNLGDMSEAVRMINGRALVEASGGVILETVRDIAKTGVDIISVGAITHSVKSLDISLDML